MRHLIWVLIVAWFMAWPVFSGDASANQRVALVIGNGAYQNAPLSNPINDARDMAVTLRELGFEVIRRLDANKGEMLDALDEFSRKLRRADVALFYYAGHGMQIRGENYLIPVSVHVRRESDVEYEAVNAGRVLRTMQKDSGGINIVILDACRDNPFTRSFRSSSRGLAVMPAMKGTFLSYATAPGATAEDGRERNGLFTKHLLTHVKTPGITIEEVFKRARVGVVDETNGRQIPWDSSSLMGNFFFAGGGQAAVPVAVPVAAPQPRPQQVAVVQPPPPAVVPRPEPVAAPPEPTGKALAIFPIRSLRGGNVRGSIRIYKEWLRKFVLGYDDILYAKYSYYDLKSTDKYSRTNFMEEHNIKLIDNSVIPLREIKKIWVGGFTKVDRGLLNKFCKKLSVDLILFAELELPGDGEFLFFLYDGDTNRITRTNNSLKFEYRYGANKLEFRKLEEFEKALMAKYIRENPQ